MEEIKRTEIASLGEFGLIERLTGHIQLKNTSTLKGVGDDSAEKDAHQYVAWVVYSHIGA